jgi:imidazolonepropionase-like amidohydrolase
MAYTMAGMSSFDALKAATVNPAKALGYDGGTIEPGKLADLIAIDGDPIANIASTYKVRKWSPTAASTTWPHSVKRAQ